MILAQLSPKIYLSLADECATRAQKDLERRAAGKEYFFRERVNKNGHTFVAAYNTNEWKYLQLALEVQNQVKRLQPVFDWITTEGRVRRVTNLRLRGTPWVKVPADLRVVLIEALYFYYRWQGISDGSEARRREAVLRNTDADGYQRIYTPAQSHVCYSLFTAVYDVLNWFGLHCFKPNNNLFIRGEKGGKGTIFSLHELIFFLHKGATYLEQGVKHDGKYFQIDHLDGNPANNDCSNLFLLTCGEHESVTRTLKNLKSLQSLTRFYQNSGNLPSEGEGWELATKEAEDCLKFGKTYPEQSQFNKQGKRIKNYSHWLKEYIARKVRAVAARLARTAFTKEGFRAEACILEACEDILLRNSYRRLHVEAPKYFSNPETLEKDWNVTKTACSFIELLVTALHKLFPFTTTQKTVERVREFLTAVPIYTPS
jgi:hypothetical protein